jgi:hypothetical protein
MLVQPSRTATVCEIDRTRERAASRKRAQNLGYRTNRWSLITRKRNLTPTSSCADCSAFTRVAARTLAPSPICDLLHRRLQPFRHPMTAPVASGWSVRRVGFAPTGKRRLLTAHTFSGHCPFPSIHALFTWHWKVGPERAASVTSSGVGGVGRKLRHPANVADDVGDKSRFTFAEQRKRSGGNRV